MLNKCSGPKLGSKRVVGFLCTDHQWDLMTDREPRTARCVRLAVLLLERGRITPAGAASALDAPLRSVRRDLQLLSTILPVTTARWGRHRYWYLDPGFGACRLGVLDRISLLVGKELTSFLEGTALHDGIWRVEDELRDGVTPRFAQHIDRKFRYHPEPARSYATQTDLLDDLLDALLRELRITIHHRRPGGDLEQRVDLEPLTLVIYRRALYLLARKPDGRIRRYAVDRIHALTKGERFDYPEDWDPDHELSGAFGFFSDGSSQRVRLRFTPRVAPYVRARTWHPSQRLLDLPDGGVELLMHASGRELVRFALEWGAQCRVLEPQWLVDEVRGELQEASAVYTRPISRGPESSSPQPPTR
jgi:predicted DNA-binding transcriptional regulator YafY